MRLLLVIAALAACKNAPQLDVDPVGLADATTFAEQFVALARPCDLDKVAALIDQEAMAAKYAQHSKAKGSRLAAKQLAADRTNGARIICAEAKTAMEFKVLHVLMVDGEPRPVVRRLVRSPSGVDTMVNYDQLQLGRSRRDHQVRVIDIYSLFNGQWMSEQISGFGDSLANTGFGDTMDVVDTIRRVRELQDAKRPGEALALLDTVPTAVRRVRLVQSMRVALALATSQDAYGQALDEIAQVFPNDPSIAMLEIDGAMLRGKFDDALHDVDFVDAAVGGDPFQDALRAQIYLKRGQPGDLDKAAARAEAATKAEPTLAKAWLAKLDVAVARERWSDAVDALGVLVRQFEMTFDETKMRGLPGNYGKLVDSPEYRAWKEP